MASTNKTTHYNLSQFVSSDTPAWLVDYNGDMGKIDTGIAQAKTTADTAGQTADTALANASNAQETANTAVTNAAAADGKATTANSNIGTMADLETVDKTSLVGAINEVHDDLVDVETAVNNVVVNSIEGESTSQAPSVKSIKDSEKYSTSEVKTGKTWTNNKPIYRKIINGNFVSGTFANLTSLNIDEVIHLEVQAKTETNDIINNNYFADANTYLRIFYRHGDKTLAMRYSGFASSNTAFVILEYTKN